VSPRGYFLALEGVEGAGKTTQARLLAEWLAGEGIPHRVAREPGGTPVGEAIRRVLLDAPDLEVPAETELLLMLAARAAYVRDVVRPAVERGEVMVSDRFELSTFAYQGIARGLGLDRVRVLNSFATGGLTPDLTVVFDVSVSEGRERQGAAGKSHDRMEREDAAFQQAVGRAYRELAASEKAVVLLDGGGSEGEVQARLRQLLASKLPGTLPQRSGLRRALRNPRP
jgi:dTMP kinase